MAEPKVGSPRDDFLKLRRQVMDALSHIDMSFGCKSYEGLFEVTVEYPCYFDDGFDRDEPSSVAITLHCYVLGPGRHNCWKGKTFREAVDACKKDVEKWIEEEVGTKSWKR